MKKAIFSLFIITIFVKVTGLIKELCLSYAYGASNISDAYIISMTIPGVVFTFVGIAITTSYIPIYMKINNKSANTIETNKYTNNLINVTLLFASIIYGISFVFTKPLIKIFAIGFSNEALILAVDFTRISLIGIFLSGVIYIFNGYLQSHNEYNYTSFVSIPVNLVATLFIILSVKNDINLLVWGSVISLIINVVFLYYRAKKSKYEYKCFLDFNDTNLRLTIRLALPLVLGISVNQLNVLVDRTIASSIIEGGISSLNYANKLNLFVYGTLVIAISTVIFPRISKFAVENKIELLQSEVSKALSLILLLLFPATIASMIFSRPIIELIYGRGEFDYAAIALTSNALFFYSIGMVFVGVREILTRCFYAFNDSKIPTKNAIIAMFLNIIMNIIFSRFMGISGLALATSVAAIISAILLLLDFNKKFNINLIVKLKIDLLKIIFATLFMALITNSLYVYLYKILSKEYSLLISVFVGLIIYFMSAYFLKIKEVKELELIVKTFITKRKEN